MRIGMLGHKVVPSRRGGIELVLTTMAPMMVKKGHEVTCYNRRGDRVENEYEGTVKNGCYEGVQLKTVWAIQKRGLSAVTSSFSAALRASFSQHDILHFHALGPCAAIWIPKLLGKRCVATVHGLDWQREKWQKGFGAKYIKFGERMIVRWADEIIVLSKGVKQYYLDTYGRETTLIPNGVTRPQTREADLITETYGLEKDSYFLLLARLTEEKGVHYLIEAYKNLKTEKKLVIVGGSSDTDEYVARLKAMAGDDPNILFTGFVSGRTLEELYSNAYVYILPSNVEGMPLSLLEALSYGNAVICSDIPENTDVIGDCGIPFRKGDVRDLTEKLHQTLLDTALVQRLKESAADYICGRYSWDHVVEETLQLYGRIRR